MYQTGYYATGYYESGYYMRGAAAVVTPPGPQRGDGAGTVSSPGGGGGGFAPYPLWAPTQEPFPDEFYEGEEEMVIALCAIFIEIIEWDH